MILVLVVLRRHFQNHCAKPREVTEGLALGSHGNCGGWARGRTLLRQEHGSCVERKQEVQRSPEANAGAFSRRSKGGREESPGAGPGEQCRMW